MKYFILMILVITSFSVYAETNTATSGPRPDRCLVCHISANGGELKANLQAVGGKADTSMQSEPSIGAINEALVKYHKGLDLGFTNEDAAKRKFENLNGTQQEAVKNAIRALINENKQQ